MSANTYIAFSGRMIKRYEGGYGWNRKDPGGPTNYGITCFDLAEYRGQKMDSMERWAPLVKAMTLEEAEAIYAKKYAGGIRYNDLPAGVDACMMDYAVNSGVSRAVLVARRIVNVAGSSSRMDQALVDAIRKTDPVWFVNTMCAERLQFMHSIRGGSAWAEFGGGWGARVSDLKQYCDHLATSAQPNVETLPEPKAPDLSKVAMPKVVHEAKTAGKTTTAAAAGTGTTAAAAGLPHSWVAGIVIGVFAAGIIYEVWQDIKTKSANNNVVIPTNPVVPMVAAPIAA